MINKQFLDQHISFRVRTGLQQIKTQGLFQGQFVIFQGLKISEVGSAIFSRINKYEKHFQISFKQFWVMYYLEIQALFKDLCHNSSIFQGKQSNSRAFQYCTNPVIECFCFVKSHLLWKSSLWCGRTRDNLENTKNRVTEHSGEGMVSQGRHTNLEEEERGQSSGIHDYHL